MPYRELPPAVSCYRHVAAAAATSCCACGRPICEICVLFEATRGLCPPCAGRARLVRRVGRGFGWAVGAIALVGFVWALGYIATHGESRPLGRERVRIEQLERELASDPCAHQAAVELSDAFIRNGDFRPAVRFGEEFSRRCDGPFPWVLQARYQAYRALGENRAAVSTAEQLIATEPRNEQYRFWRALAREDLGDLEGAAQDYRLALGFQPRLEHVPWNLVDVLERLGRPCEGVPVVEEYLRHYPWDSRAPIILGRVAHLRALGCKFTDR